MKSPIRWVGGKHRLAEQISSLLPSHDCYVETCVGAAWVFFSKPRTASKVEVLNDIDRELVNLYCVLQRSGKRLIREVDTLPYSRTIYDNLWHSKPSSQFKRASRYLYLNRVGFGGKMNHRSFGTGTGRPFHVLPMWLRDSPDALVERLRGVILESLDVEEIIRRYDRPQTLFFVDPPYLGLTQPYVSQFGLEDHVRLAGALRAIRGKFILSCNDCPKIRRLHTGLSITKVQTNYTISRGAGTPAGEILVANFPLPRSHRKMKSRTPFAPPERKR